MQGTPRFYAAEVPLDFMHEDVLRKLVAWGEGHQSISAMILTSTRARPDGTADALSDYDVILAVTDVMEYIADDAWSCGYGQPIARWGDENELYETLTYFRSVVYEDGAKIDYTIWPESLLDRVSEAGTLPPGLDVGYLVLLDKDRRTSRWVGPTYKAHIPEIPSEAEYGALIEEFWWNATYVAKALWRGEVFFAKKVLGEEHDVLRRLLEWRIEIDHEWSLRPGAYGRGFERLLPVDIQTDLAKTYVGVNIADNWTALSDMAALVRRVATEIGDALTYEYPQRTDEVLTAHLQAVQKLSRSTGGEQSVPS